MKSENITELDTAVSSRLCKTLPRTREMAEKMSAVEDYLTCPVCLEWFKEPVTLGCNHSFCSSCLNNFWYQNIAKKCPVCRRKSSKDILGVNFALKELVISVSERRGSESQTPVCSRHPEVPPLFCEDEARALCPICEFSQHKEHTVVSVEEAEAELKEQLRAQIEALKKQRGEVEEKAQAYKQIQQYAEKQAELCERQIRAVFERLHRFLKEEEMCQLTALRKEQLRQAQTMSPELERIKETLSSLTQDIQGMEKQLDRKTVDFILSHRPAPAPQPLPPLRTGLLVNQAQVLGNLEYRIWRKMRDIVHFSPVILDPNTADPSLRLSEDLTSVRFTDTRLQLPDNPERFKHFICVLGSGGFSSGTHCWEVEVGDHPSWIIGVAKESVRRKKQQLPSPENGLWCLGLHKDEYFVGYDDTLQMNKRPQKIQVQLDYSRGRVFFYDSSDLSLIYTHSTSEKLTEKLFPCFVVGLSAADCGTTDIRICPDPQDQS